MNDQNNLLAFKKFLKEKNLDGFIVTNPTNIFYLTGFKGVLPAEREAILVFDPSPTLITARIYQNEAARVKSRNLKIKIVAERNQIFESSAKLFKKAKRIGFEENDLKVAELKEFKKVLKKVRLIATKNLIEDLRIIKTEDEVKRIEKAQIISQKAFNELIKTIKVGQTEVEIAEKLASIIKSLGANGLAFEGIVAAGRNAGLPHYVTGNSKVTKGDVLLFDFGAKYKDYCADLSRTIFAGKVSDEKRNIYSLVKHAQKEAIQKIIHGIKSHKPHEHAVDIFRKENLDDYFLHGLGHGIGLAVHEAPHLRPNLQTTDYQLLTNNMVFSVEPGLYFPSWGGVRIEDLVVIKNGKAQVLGKSESEIT